MYAGVITDKLGLHSLRQHHWYIQSTCATLGEGLYEGLEWLSNNIANMDEIFKTIQENSSLSHIEVVEKCFGPQRHSSIIGFSGGMKRKHFNDSKTAYVKDLDGKLQEKEEENNALKKRMDAFESRLIQIAAFEDRLIQIEKDNQATPVSPHLAANI